MKEKLVQLIKKSKKNEKGFTLIEMIVVIAIIGVLAAILVPSMAGYINNSKEATRTSDARTVYTAAQAGVTSLVITGDVNEFDMTATTGLTGEQSKIVNEVKNLIGATNFTKLEKCLIKVTGGSVTIKYGDANKTLITLPNP